MMEAAFGDLRGAELIEALMVLARQQNPDLTDEQLRQQFGLTFAATAAARSTIRPTPHVDIPAGMELLVWYLVRDGFLVQQRSASAEIELNGMPFQQRYVLTEAGEAFVDG